MAVSVYVCGQAGANTGTLVVPIIADVPRTDPILGASIILIFWQTSYPGSVSVIGATDDALPQDDYSLCLFDDGLNHYDTLLGLVVNDLTNGVNNVTVTLDSAPDGAEVTLIAVTGVGGAWPSAPFDPTLAWLFSAIMGTAEGPLGGGTGSAQGVSWTDTGAGDTPVIHAPLGATEPGNWDWLAGADLAIYELSDNTSTSDQLGWSWADGAIADLIQWNIDPGIGRFMSGAVGLQNPVTLGAAGPSLDGAWGNAGSKFFTGGNAYAFAAGAGPADCTTPPLGGNPVFNNHIRLSE